MCCLRDVILKERLISEHLTYDVISFKGVTARCSLSLTSRGCACHETQLKLILTLLNMLYDEIIKGRQELEDFATKFDQGLVESDKAASVQRKLQHTRQYLSDFESRLTRNLGPVHLQNQLIPKPDNLTIPQLSASLVIQMSQIHI